MSITQWLGISWCQPENKIYFLLFLAATILLLYKLSRSFYLIKVLGKTIQGHRFLKNFSRPRAIAKSILWALALFCIFLTLLHPCWNTKEETVIQEGRDIFVALDISRSMLAQDTKPNRLEFAKQKIRALVNDLPSERIGLILFSGSSFIQCPLTRDRAAFFMYLNQIDVDTIASGSTALEQAIGQALQAFNESKSQKNKLLVLFTDGEDFSSHLANYKQEAQAQGLTIFTIGIGTPHGAPIPLYNPNGIQSGHLKDAAGSVVITSLNEPLLQSLAHEVGGIYLHATDQNNDLKKIIHLVQQKEREKIEERTMAQTEEQYPWFLFISFMLLALEWLL